MPIIYGIYYIGSGVAIEMSLKSSTPSAVFLLKTIELCILIRQIYTGNSFCLLLILFLTNPFWFRLPYVCDVSHYFTLDILFRFFLETYLTSVRVILIFLSL